MSTPTTDETPNMRQHTIRIDDKMIARLDRLATDDEGGQPRGARSEIYRRALAIGVDRLERAAADKKRRKPPSPRSSRTATKPPSPRSSRTATKPPSPHTVRLGSDLTGDRTAATKRRARKLASK